MTTATVSQMAPQTLTEASREWATRPADQRFQSLKDLSNAVNNRRMHSASVDEPLSALTVTSTPEGKLQIGNGRKMTPTHWSFGQFAGLVKAPAAFLRSLKVETAAHVLNECIDRAPREAMKVMSVRGDEGTKLQAVTSVSYGRIWDAEVVDAAMRIQERSNGKFHNPLAYSRTTGAPVPSGLYASDRDVFIFMIDGGSTFDKGPRAKLNRGFFMKNSEVGASTFELTTFLFNIVCGNHYVFGAQNISKLVVRHTSGGPERFVRQAMPLLLDYAKQAPELSAVEKAQTMRLKDIAPAAADVLVGTTDWARAFGKKYGFTMGEVDDAVETAQREEHKCDTLWDLMQGFTATAREYEFVDARVDLEKRASKLFELAV